VIINARIGDFLTAGQALSAHRNIQLYFYDNAAKELEIAV